MKDREGVSGSMKAEIQEIVWSFEALREDFECAGWCKTLLAINGFGWALIALVIFSAYFLHNDIASWESFPVWTVGIALSWNGFMAYAFWRTQSRCEARRDKLDQDLRAYGLALPYEFHRMIEPLDSETPARRSRGFATRQSKGGDWVGFDVFNDKNYC
jgi:hypothetical protein